jgi:hypothetical protein
MKTLLLALASIVSLVGSVSMACQNGDTSKILLVISETSAGQENAVIGSVSTADGSVSFESNELYVKSRLGSVIMVKSFYGRQYKFDMKTAYQDDRFCFAAVYAR